jgi:hypothetical protein
VANVPLPFGRSEADPVGIVRRNPHPAQTFGRIDVTGRSRPKIGACSGGGAAGR